MSNHLAIATVTATLKNLVTAAAERAVPGAVVLAGRPSAPTADDQPKVHVYLYQVTHNAALRSADLPTRNAEGRLVRRPQAAIDLHYLMSFYGDNTVFEPDRMLGAVVTDLHAHPLLGRAAIQGAMANAALAGSDLDAALEHVKFTPMQISLDELTKLWSMMVQVPHVLSVAYIGSVVLLDAEERPEGPLPVLRRGEDDRGVETRLGPFPRLSSVWIGAPATAARRPRPASLPNAQLGAQLVIAGAELGGDAMRLRFVHVPIHRRDGSIATVPPRELEIPGQDRTADEIRVQLPDDAAAQTDWPAGIYTISAVVRRGESLRPAAGALPLALAPHVVSIAPNPAVRNAGDVVLTVTCRPRVLEAQMPVLMLGDREVAPEPFGDSTDVLTFTIRNAPLVANAIVRLRVDGVESMPFTIDAASAGFVFDDQQRITIR
jgi:hypothetical protein